MFNPDYYLDTSQYPLKLVSIKWERVQLYLTLSLGQAPSDTLDFYLFHPQTERTVYFRQVKQNGEFVHLRINLSVAWENQKPVPSGRWVIVVKDRSTEDVSIATTATSLIDFVTTDRDHNMNHYRKVFNPHSENYYSVRPMANDGNKLFYLAIYNKGEHLRTPREISREIYRKKRNERSLRFRQKIFDLIYKMSGRLVGIKNRQILFTSDSRAVIGGNLKFVYDKIIERKLDEKFEMKMMFKENITRRRNFLDKFKLPYYLATSKTILLDDFHPMLYNVEFDKSQNIIQLWHASGPFKTVGYSRVGKPGGPTINANSHKIYTSAIVASEHSIPFYAEAFGMAEADVYPTGIPRIDPFFDEAYKEKIRNKMYKAFPKAKNANVILFAPTFRGSGPKTAYYPLYQLHLESLANYARENNSVIIFKLHPFVREKIEIPEQYEDVFIDAFNYREINDILLISDVLITDYSSVVFEYSLLNKPMIFYAFDFHQYISSRDFYEGFQDFVPGKIVMNFNELMKALVEQDYEMDKVQQFRDKYFKYQDSNSTDRVIDWLILDKFPEEIPRGPRQKLL
ncbi:CDP-glycerol glycerophosphotransferase family protein [Sporosarcina jiandibaonis]|uniref:CDP-glycerol glycerophosphotransferase family protein n=1 Tax=Sporosarcina jiandibaonis TaxID=2715535 RepID=UPI0015544C1D|nr:CDP-glycerol glycerophosphotransferase family protein [Sporosarcina jiandibaonis]